MDSTTNKLKSRCFSKWSFLHVGAIEPERDENGAILEFMPQNRYKKAATTPLNVSGAGPFCRFRIAQNFHQSGLYVLALNDIPVYAGECEDLAIRWGLSQYAHISPKNCFKGGQSTNCRVNAAILMNASHGSRLDLWFVRLDGIRDERLAAETVLIRDLKPEWNRAKR